MCVCMNTLGANVRIKAWKFHSKLDICCICRCTKYHFLGIGCFVMWVNWLKLATREIERKHRLWFILGSWVIIYRSHFNHSVLFLSIAHSVICPIKSYPLYIPFSVSIWINKFWILTTFLHIISNWKRVIWASAYVPAWMLIFAVIAQLKQCGTTKRTIQ